MRSSEEVKEAYAEGDLDERDLEFELALRELADEDDIDGEFRGGILEEFECYGLDCRISVVELGGSLNHYTGYVRVPEDVQSEVRFQSVSDDKNGLLESDFSVHGGVTYGPDDDGWIGFDCAHAGDVSLTGSGDPLPGDVNQREYERDRDMFRTVWTPESVREEVAELAEQVAEFVDGGGD